MAPGTSAQRSREHRNKVKEDPEKYQLYLKKEKERYKRRKEEGKLKAKKNFFLLTTIPFNFGFERLTWNFLEAGHGKGPADGVGAAVKRRADALVATRLCPTTQRSSTASVRSSGLECKCYGLGSS